MAGIAGKKALVKIPGVAVSFTAEAFTDSGDHQTYQITATAKRVWDQNAAITIKVGGVTTGESYTINRLLGTVKFATVNAGRGAVTADGSYLPMSTVAEAKEYSYTITAANAIDCSFGDDWATRVRTTLDVSATLNRWWVDVFFRDALIAATVLVLQFYSDSSGSADLLAWVLPKGENWSSQRAGLSEESLQFDGVLDADNRAISLA